MVLMDVSMVFIDVHRFFMVCIGCSIVFIVCHSVFNALFIDFLQDFHSCSMVVVTFSDVIIGFSTMFINFSTVFHQRFHGAYGCVLFHGVH